MAKVAIVDDDRDARALLRALLEEHGHDVFEASSGLRLISLLRVDRPELILLDVRMSWIDGFELCRALKSNPEYRGIPVVFVTALTAPEKVREGLAAGAAAYFTKPLDLGRLLGAIDALVGGAHAAPR